MFFATVRNNLAALCLVIAVLLLFFVGDCFAARSVSLVLIAYAALLIIMGNQTLMSVRYTERVGIVFTERVTQYGIRCLYDPRYEDVIPDANSRFLLLFAMAVFPILDFGATLLNQVFHTQRFGQLHDIEQLVPPISYHGNTERNRG